jgi:uncharacterized SAM-binding protein YcdF (DUF218 family)
MADYEEMTASKKLAAFIEKNKKAFIAILIVLVCCLIGYIVFASIAKSNKAKNLQTLDEISYEFTSKSNDLEDAEIDARIAAALEKAAPLTKKGGVVGARANMFCAELAFTQEKYDDAANYWKAAADKAKKTYLAPIACFNLAVCYENLGNSARLLNKEEDKVVIITNDFHLFRAEKLAKAQGYKHVSGWAADSYPPMQIHNLMREFFGVVKDFLMGNLTYWEQG